MHLDEILEHGSEPIVERWYERWRAGEHPHLEIDERGLKNGFRDQLRAIGEQLQNFEQATDPASLWNLSPELHPEHRINQGVPIEEVVQEYGCLVDSVRDWIDEHHLDVPFREYSYFYRAVFELVARSVREYARLQSERITQGRSEYLAGLTHQMRTPLSILAMNLKLVESSNERPTPALLEAMRRAVQRLKLLIDGVMRLERFQPGELPVHPQTVRLARLIEEVISENEWEANAKGLGLHVSLNWALIVKIDPDLFRDVLGNLVQNAVKYTMQGSVRIEVKEEPGRFFVTVRDSGPGVDSDRKALLFRPVHPSMPGGGGIGLTVAHRAVVAQGGEIGIETPPGDGCVFWFWLPKEVSARTPARLPPAP